MNSSTVFLIAFFTSLLTATGTTYLIARLDLLQSGTDARGEIIVPNLRGLSEEDAVANARASGLLFMIGAREPNAEAKEGTVIRQSIPAGETVKKGQPVTVTLAEALPKVPPVEGKTLEEATALIQQAGYQLSAGKPIPDDAVPVGAVISQVPKAGSPLAKEQIVTVRISAGPGELEVPKVTGLTFTPAKAKLEELGLEHSIRWISRAETVSNVVLRQTPEAGEKVKPGTKIELTINRE